MTIQSGYCGIKPYTTSEAATQLCWADGTLAGTIVVEMASSEDNNEVIVHWDAQEKSLTLQHAIGSRKSLYYVADEQRIVFSTRLPQLLNMCGTSNIRFDHRCIADLIVVGFVAAPRTPYKGIYQLAPGSQIVWRHGSTELEYTFSGCTTVQATMAGVRFSGRAGSVPTHLKLSDNVMMVNAIPQLAALSGEAHGDPGLLRLLLRLARRRSESCHIHLGSDLEPEMLQVATRFNQPWIRRGAQKELQQYWYDVRYPEIVEWFSPPQTMHDGEWVKYLIVCERLRAIQLISTAYQQTAEYHLHPHDDEETMGAKVNHEMFSLTSTEVGNVFCRAVRLKVNSEFIAKFINLSPAKVFRRDEAESNNSLIGLICGMTSLNYLERFYHRLSR